MVIRSVPSVPPDNKRCSCLLADIFKAYYEARKKKRNTYSQVRFEEKLSANLISLYEEVRDRTYKPGRSMCFIIRDPVQREIFAASFRDRIIHHYLYDKLEKIFEPAFIYDSYSCRKGKGTLFGIERLEHHIRSCSDNYHRECYVLKLDLEGYFMNIDRCILFDLIMKKIDDKYWRGCLPKGFDYDTVVFLLKKVVFLDPTAGCRIKGKKEDWRGLPPTKSLFYSKPRCGLPIGNLTSQLFSNIYLNELDWFCKRELKAKHYGRYVDDFFIVAADKSLLIEYKSRIRIFLTDFLHLKLNDAKTRIYSTKKGVPFLGAVVSPSGRFMRSRTRRHLNEKCMQAICYERNPYVKRAIINAQKGFYTHFNEKCM